MSVLKQLVIHSVSAKFGLPWEMTHEILRFCFYDTITAVYRAIHKATMAEIVGHFDNAYISRAKPERGRGSMAKNPDTSEKWAFCLSRFYKDADDEVQFQAEVQFYAVNCSACGNYKRCCTFQPTEEQIGDNELQFVDDRFWLEAIPLRMRCDCYQ